MKSFQANTYHGGIETMKDQDILVQSYDEHVGTLVLNRPERKNALSPELLIRIHMVLKEWADRGDVRAVIITGGKGKAFSSGYDIAALPTDINPEMAEILKKHNPVELAFQTLENFPYPTIAMMNGYAFGAGLNLTMCCDIRIAVEDIRVGMPPAKLGLVYHPEGIRQFLDVVGMAKTREIFFTARTYTGREVFDMGLVDHLVAHSDLSRITCELAGEIAANAPLALKGTKRILGMFRANHTITSEQYKEAEIIINEAFNSQDIKEGQTAFFEKRKPLFTGE